MPTHERTPLSPSEATSETTRAYANRPIGGGEYLTLGGTSQADWLRFLGRFILVAVLMNILFWAMIILWFIPASQGSSLAPAYDELVAASRNLAMYRLAIALDFEAWLQLGVLFVAFAAILARHAPVRSMFIAACGAGQVAGMIGGAIRFRGIGDLAASYLTAVPEQQAALLRSFLDLDRVVNGHFMAGSLLWAVALLLIASATWSLQEVPRWLTVVIALPGMLHLTSLLLEMVMGTGLGFAVDVLSIFLLTVVDIAIAVVFWRRGWTFSARPGKAARLHREPGTEA
jgi:hypothetical protein